MKHLARATQVEIELAERALKVFEEGVKEDTAAAPYEGWMVDVPVAERAKTDIARAKAIEKLKCLKAEALKTADSYEKKLELAVTKSRGKSGHAIVRL